MMIAGYKNEASFYASPKWSRLREAKLCEDPLCEECFKKGITKEAEEVDHIIPIRVAPYWALSFTNLQSLCKPCHSRKTAQELNRYLSKRRKGKIINKVWDV